MGTRENRIKIIIPNTYNNYESGDGEACFVLVDNETMKTRDNGVSGGVWFGTLDTDSWYYAGIVSDTEIAFEMRGEKYPVATWNWIESLQKDTVCSFCGSIVRFEWDHNRFIALAVINSACRERSRRRTMPHMTELTIDGKSLKVKNGTDDCLVHVHKQSKKVLSA